MEALLGSMAEGILLVDEEGELLIFNAAARRFLGFEKDQKVSLQKIEKRFHGWGFLDLSLWPGKRSCFLPQSKVIRVLSQGRGEHYFRVFQKPLERGHQPLGYLTLLQDITEEKKLGKLKDEFIATVSHELRTPLTIVMGSIGNLKDGVVGALTERQRAVVASAHRNTERLRHLIDDLLDLSRLESGKTEILMEPITVATLLKKGSALFQQRCSRAGIMLKVNTSNHFPPLYGDSALLTQVLSNLLSNALRYARNEIVVEVQKKDSFFQFCVADDGPGISPADQKKLFSKFEQIHRPRGGGGYKGTGLGLAICKEIVELHQGRIWVERGVDPVTRFYFQIPLRLSFKQAKRSDKINSIKG